MTPWQLMIPLSPLIVYASLFVYTWNAQKMAIPDRLHSVLDQRMGYNLTLAGFAAAILAILAVNPTDSDPSRLSTTYALSLTMSTSLSSYALLHLRIRRGFEFWSDSLTSTSLWTLALGLMSLYQASPRLYMIANVFLILVVALGIYFILDFRNKLRTL